MIAFEVAFIIVIGIVIVVGLRALGKPIAEAYSEKMKSQYKQMDSKQAQDFQSRISDLEQQVRELKAEVSNVKATADFAVKMQQDQPAGEKIQLGSEMPQRKER